MAMSSAQKAAFQTANSGNTAFSPENLTLLIAGIGATAILLWFVWVVISAYKASGSANGLRIDDVGSITLRALFVLVVFLAIVSY